MRENTNDGANGGQVRTSFICFIVTTNYVIIKSFSLELLLYHLSYLSNQLMLIFFCSSNTVSYEALVVLFVQKFRFL